DHAKWFKKHGAWGTEPVPGAIVFFDWKGSKDIDAIDHVGIVKKVDGKKIHTIEANVDGIHLREKVRDESIIVGYGYPSKVKVASEGKYTPKHAAPAPSPSELTEARAGEQSVAHTREGAPEEQAFLSGGH